MAALPSIGLFRDLVRIEARQTVSDGMGGFAGTWRTIAGGLPARIAPVKGGEEIRSLRLSGVSLFDITIRQSGDTAGLAAEHRIVNERSGLSFNVRWVANLDERGIFLTATCEAGGLTDG